MTEDELPLGWAIAPLDLFLADRGTSVDPARTPDTAFTLYSVPAHANGRPVTCLGHEIGSTKQAVAPGTVLLSKINPRINRVWTVADHAPTERVIASTEWLTFPRSEALTSGFLSLYLKREQVRSHLAGSASGVGGSLMRINGSVVAGMIIPIAPLAEQARIVTAVNDLFADVEAGEAALARAREALAQFRASLLHAAVTGQLTEAWRAANPPTEDGPALLRRILIERRTAWERAELARLTARGTPPRNDAWKARYVEPVAPDVEAMPQLPDSWGWASLD